MLEKEKLKRLNDLIPAVETQAFVAVESTLDVYRDLRANILFAVYNVLVDMKNDIIFSETDNNLRIKERNDAIRARNLKCDHSPDLIATKFFNEFTPMFFIDTRKLNLRSINSFYEKYFDELQRKYSFKSDIIEPIEEYDPREEQ